MWWPAFRSGDAAGGGAEGSSVWGDRLFRPPRGKALSLQTPPSWQAVPSPAPPAPAGPPELCHLPSGCQPPGSPSHYRPQLDARYKMAEGRVGTE